MGKVEPFVRDQRRWELVWGVFAVSKVDVDRQCFSGAHMARAIPHRVTHDAALTPFHSYCLGRFFILRQPAK
jgi:hypothetical protein